jgi:hypothetical protein
MHLVDRMDELLTPVLEHQVPSAASNKTDMSAFTPDAEVTDKLSGREQTNLFTLLGCISLG